MNVYAVVCLCRMWPVVCNIKIALRQSNIFYYMTDNKTRTITFYKVKHVDDDTKECFICSAVNIRQLLIIHKKTAK